MFSLRTLSLPVVVFSAVMIIPALGQASGAFVTTLAGGGQCALGPIPNGPGRSTCFSLQGGVAVDAQNTTAWVTDVGNCNIRTVNIASTMVTTSAGPDVCTGFISNAGYVNGVGTNVRFNQPWSAAVQGSGTNAIIWAVDSGNNVIRAMAVSSGLVTTVAGGGAGTTSNGFADGIGTTAIFSYPSGITIGSTGAASGYAYISDTGNNCVRAVLISSNTVTTLVGGGAGTHAGFADGTGSSAKFFSPRGLAIDSLGANIYIADTQNNLVRSINIVTRTVITIAGGGAPGGFSSGYSDGLGSAAMFWSPVSVADDNWGNIFIADYNNNRIRAITVFTGVVTTLAGTGYAGFVDGPGLSAFFCGPCGLANAPWFPIIYLYDCCNSALRAITYSTPSMPPTPSQTSSPASFSPTPTLTPTPSVTQQFSTSSTMIGAIIGGVVALLIVLLLSFAIYFFRRKGIRAANIKKLKAAAVAAQSD